MDKSLPLPDKQGTFRFDLVAGLSIAGLLLPEAIAYAGIANLPPQSGLVALLAGLLVYGLLGSSRFAIVSSTSSAAAVLGSALIAWVGLNAPERYMLAYALVMVTGVFLLLAGLFKLGEITHFIAKPVLKGFSFGLALTIIVKQLPHMVQLNSTHSDFFRQGYELFSQPTHWNLYALGMGLSAFIILKTGEKFRQIPVALLVIIAGILLDYYGITTQWHIAAVGHFELQLPQPAIPNLTLDTWLRLAEIAVAMVLIIYAESYTSIRTFALKYQDESKPNRDLVALGAANVLSGALQGMPVGAGYSATSANEEAGARSKKAGWIAAAAIAILIIGFSQYIAYIPQPVLAAIVIHAVSGHVKLQPFRQYFSWHKDRIVSLSAILCVLLFGILNGLLVAIGISIIMMLKNFSRTRIAWLGRVGNGHDFVDIKRFPHAVIPSGLLIARPDEPVFFANAERIFSEILLKAQQQKPQRLVLSLEESPTLDSSSIEALLLFLQHLKTLEIDYQLARVRLAVATTLQYVNSPLLPEAYYASQSVDDAVNAFDAVNM